MSAKRPLVALFLAVAVLVPTPAMAWADHDLLTREILRPVTWLNAYRHIKVTKWTYGEVEKGPISPDFKPVYIDKLVGETTNAREILIRYVDEPDWGLDEKLELSPLQTLAGGSKGYRHQCYHFLNGALEVGEAPKRAKAYYELARIAFRKHDPYWGFRYLARSIHYMEDMGQPYHTNPMRLSYLWDAKFNLKSLTTLCSNMHYYYEFFVSYQLRKQAAAGKGKWIGAIQDAEPGDVFDPEAAASALGDFSSENSGKLLEACDHFWPKRVKSTKEIRAIRPSDLELVEPPPSYATIDDVTTLQLHVTSKMVRGLMSLAKRDVLVVPTSDEEE
ncbi:MAG TPA: hypothetical protein V6D05_01415 [Stenomitos sp.]